MKNLYNFYIFGTTTIDEVRCWSTWAQIPTFTNFLHVTMTTLQMKKTFNIQKTHL
jgi:hypothetical protein